MENKRIVVVEDDLDISAMFAEVLTSEGYAVTLWRTGAGAFDFIQRINPALVVLDMQMETPDAGLKVVEALCAHPDTKEIPVIVCSAGLDTQRDKRQTLEALGCNIHSKPVNMDAFLALIKHLTQALAVTG
ncbi:MAG: response regulator [Thermomicrobia bacterium]|nr:response regulator [Thermomicrobia bacterium]